MKGRFSSISESFHLCNFTHYMITRDLSIKIRQETIQIQKRETLKHLLPNVLHNEN